MIIIRPIQRRDFEDYQKLADESQVNFFTLPKDKRLLEMRLETSIESFASQVFTPERESYLFVAIDTQSKKLLGISGLTATTGGNEPLYFYRREVLSVESRLDAVVKKISVLNPVSYVRGPSEVCSLFVHNEARGSGVGKLLSISRFLFIARFRERFTGSIMAELRGVLQDGTSPFWDGVGRHFFNMSLHEAFDLLMYGRSFIGQFLPKYPIYIDLLPKEVQEVLGKVDKETMGAFSMLRRFGFEISDEIDVFDAGPKLKALKENISPIVLNKTAEVSQIRDRLEGDPRYFVSNDRLDFRAAFANLDCQDDGKVQISRELASMLEIGLGDQIRYLDGTTQMVHK